MKKVRVLAFGALGAASLALCACTPEEIAALVALITGSGDFSNRAARLIVPSYAMPGPSKASTVKPRYVVHWGEITTATHTASIYMATAFGESTPLTFGYKANKKNTVFVVDPKAPTPTAAAFVKERLEEVSPLTFTVTSAKVRGGARVTRKSPTVRTTITVTFRATVDSGASAGKSFSGKLTLVGDATDFASE